MRSWLLTGVVFSLCASSFAASLKNDGFESGDYGDWQVAGEGWRVSNYKLDSRKGQWGVVNDVLVGGGDEYRVVHQRIKTSGGKKYEAEVWLRTVCLEGSESFLEVQFMDKGGAVLKQYQSDHVTGDQEFTLMKIENMEAPEETYWVSVRGVVHVIKPPEINPDYHVFDHFDFGRARNR